MYPMHLVLLRYPFRPVVLPSKLGKWIFLFLVGSVPHSHANSFAMLSVPRRSKRQLVIFSRILDNFLVVEHPLYSALPTHG